MGEITSSSAGERPLTPSEGGDGCAHAYAPSPPPPPELDPDQEPVAALTDDLAATIEEALRDDETEGMTLVDLAHYVAERIVDAGSVIHAEVCEACGQVDTHHMLDSGHHCITQFDSDSMRPAAFVGSIS